MKRLILTALLICALSLTFVGCSNTVALDAEVQYNRSNGYLFIDKDPEVAYPDEATASEKLAVLKQIEIGGTWKNIELVLNHTYTLPDDVTLRFLFPSDTYGIEGLKATAMIHMTEFVDGDKYFNPETTKPIHFKISCDLADGKRGEYVKVWE